MIKRGLLGLLLLAASSLVVLAPASALNPCDPSIDVTQPAYKSASFSPTSIVVGHSKQTVHLTVKASDACGVKTVSAQLIPHGNPNGGVIYFPKLTRTGGSATSGTWTGQTQVGAWAVGGTWDALYVQIEDVNYNIAIKSHKVALVIRHSTKTKFYKPVTKIDRNKSVTLKGYVLIAGSYTTTKVQIQSRASGHKWAKLANVTTDGHGNFKKKVKVTKTKQYRVKHLRDGSTTGSTSPTHSVRAV